MTPRRGPLYRLGSNVEFGPGAEGTGLLGTGWSAPDPAGFAWSDGPEAELAFAVATPSRDVVARLELMPFVVPGAVSRQTVELFFNFFRVGYAELKDGRHEVAVHLPRELFMLRTAVLTLHIPNATSPRELELSGDERRLGVALWRFGMAPAA